MNVNYIDYIERNLIFPRIRDNEVLYIAQFHLNHPSHILSLSLVYFFFMVSITIKVMCNIYNLFKVYFVVKSD